MTGPPPRRSPFDALPEWVGPGTRLIHGARRAERNAGAVVPPIYQTSTFHFPAAFSEAAPPGEPHLYSRYANPTVSVAEELVRGLEGGEEARLFGSGMGAIAATLLAFVRPGDRIVALEALYGGTLDLLGGPIRDLGVGVDWVPAGSPGPAEGAVPAGTRIVLLESPTNPLLRVVDIAAWAEAADRAHALLVVDNTFATPVNQRPLDLGADLVVHSATKYLGGHSDLLAGAVVGPRPLLARVETMRRLVGAVLDPFAAFLLARGLRTLPLRVARQNATAAALAAALEGHPAVARLHFPGAASAAEEAIAARQMAGRGGLLGIELRRGAEAAAAFLGRLRLVHVAASLGGVESLASRPPETSHAHLAPEELARRGIAPGLVRFSVGIEETADLVRDVREALDGL